MRGSAILCLCFLVIGPQLALAQNNSAIVSFNLPSIALVDIEPAASKNFNLSFSVPTEAGRALANTSTNSSLWLNHTSAVASGVTRRITANISGVLPGGFSLRLEVLTSAATGGGVKGTAMPILTLSSSPQTIISGIGGAYTGNGVNNGFNLRFSAQYANYALLRAGSSTVTVVYTMLDN